ncbi:MAG: phage tail tape measure protein [Desulfohalobiaceae bacterium]|nr:phage tail tape measure protein [Desulfohalobiaceae bacterium]
MPENRVRITLTASGEDAEQAFRGLNRQLDTTQREAKQTQRRMRDLNEYVDRGARVLGGLVTAATGAGAALAYVSKQQLNNIQEMQKNAEMAGLNVEAYQELSHAAAEYQVTQEALSDGLKEMTLRADEFAVTGKGPAAEAFDRLGISSADLNSKLADAPALFSELIDRMEDLDKAAQIRIADEIFGGQGGEQFVALIEGGADALSGLRQEARELGLVMDRDMVTAAVEANEEIDKLSRVISAQFSVALAEVAPDIADITQDMLDWVGANKAFLTQDVPGHIRDMAGAVSDFVNSREFQLISEYWEVLAGAGIGLKFGGLKGAAIGAAGGFFYDVYKDAQDLEEKIKAVKEQLSVLDPSSPFDEQQYDDLQKQLEMYEAIKRSLQEVDTSFIEMSAPPHIGPSGESGGDDRALINSWKDTTTGIEETTEAFGELIKKGKEWDETYRRTMIQQPGMGAMVGADDDWVRAQAVRRAEEAERANDRIVSDTKETTSEIEQIIHRAFHERLYDDMTDGIRDLMDDWKGGFSGFGDWLEDWAKDTAAAILGAFAHQQATPIMLPIGGSVSGGKK